MIYRASKNQLCHLLTSNRQADSFYVVVYIISIVFVGDFFNKNTQFYGYRLFSDVKIRHFFKRLFWTASEILFTNIKLYCRQGPNIQKTLLIEYSFRIKIFNVTAHFRAVSQAKTECENRHILSRFDTCPAWPYPQAEKWSYHCYYFKLHKISEIYS